MTVQPTGDTDPTISRGRGASRVLTMLLKYGVPLVITVGLCWLLLRDTDLEAMWAIVRRDCDSRWLILDVACLIGAMVARALRWQIQLRALDIRASAGLLTLSVFGTYAVNMVFPRLGEVWRTGFVAARCRSPFTKVFGSMVADRLTDTVAVALISLLAFILAGPQLMDFLANAQGGAAARIGSLLMSPMLWGAIAAVTLIGVWLAVRYPQSRVVSGVRKVVRGLWDGFAVIARMPGKGLWLFYTIALWNCYFWGLWAVFESFPLLREVISQYGLTALLVAFVLTSLSMLVPSNGGLGPWQWAMIFALGFYSSTIPGLDREYMSTFANLALGVQTILSITLGIITFAIIAFTRQSSTTPSHTS